VKKATGTQAVMRINLLYSCLVILLAGLAMWLFRSLIVYVAIGAMLCLVLISVWHHHKARVLRSDTILEYLLLLAVAAAVLFGVTQR
jgi:Flp pilus assembly protein TadB